MILGFCTTNSSFLAHESIFIAILFSVRELMGLVKVSQGLFLDIELGLPRSRRNSIDEEKQVHHLCDFSILFYFLILIRI